MYHVLITIIEDADVWAPLLLVTAIALRSRLVLLAIIAIIAIVLTGCVSSPPPPCADVGCASRPVTCSSRQGPCYCAQPDGGRVECELGPSAHPDAGATP